MPNEKVRTMPTRLLITTVAVALLAAGCASSKSSGNSGGGSSQPAGGSTTVKISVQHDRLTAPDGKTLYYNTVDTAKSIKCVGACASEWPPLAGTPQAGSGLDSENLSTAARPDGTTQITFYGHPLYEFKGDGPGDAKGGGIADAGGQWVVATPEQAAGGSSSPTESNMSSQSSGGGYSYP
jgi:predicted lipoprotein with Yx(FWY)xxD motif